MLVEAAHVAVRVRDSRLRAFYLRVKAKKGEKTVIVAVARKMFTIIWFLLVKGEKFIEYGLEKISVDTKVAYHRNVSLEEMVIVLRSVGYFVSGRAG